VRSGLVDAVALISNASMHRRFGDRVLVEAIWDSNRRYLDILQTPESLWFVPHAEPSNPAFPVVFKQTLKRVLEHWTRITFILALIGTGLSILTLYVYARAIGRADLFMVAIEEKSY